jgi:hypothetical protein
VDLNPWGVPFFVVTHRPQEQPEGHAFTFVEGVAEAVASAKEAGVKSAGRTHQLVPAHMSCRVCGDHEMCAADLMREPESRTTPINLVPLP